MAQNITLALGRIIGGGQGDNISQESAAHPSLKGTMVSVYTGPVVMLLLKGQQNNTQSHQLNLDTWKVALIQQEISLGTQVICIFSKCLTYLQQLGRLTLQKLKLFKMSLRAKKAAGPLHKGSFSHGTERDSNLHLHSSGHSERFPRRSYSKSLS